MSAIIDLERTKTDLIAHLQDTILQLENTDITSLVKTHNISAAEIKDEKFIRQFAAKFPKTGSHIYWFKVDKPSELIEQFGRRSINSNYKIARYNKNTESEYVYVGSCTRIKLGDRFKQHCGYGHSGTYSLQLSKWIDSTNLLFTFSYVEIENKLIVQ